MTTLNAEFKYAWQHDLIALKIITGLEDEGYKTFCVSTSPSGLAVGIETDDPIRSAEKPSRRTKLAAERLWALILRHTGISARVIIVNAAETAA